MKVVVGLSGGVDSSVAAALLQKQGYQVSAVTMKTWEGEDISAGRRHGCYGPGEAEDIADARRAAQTLGIPHYIVDLRQEYQTEVLDYFRQEYLAGRTPNPCLRCNRQVKFAALLSRLRATSRIEFDCFATGHYARREYDKRQLRHLLKKARDLSQDQSYFISSLSQEQLARSLFPLGNYTKAEVRGMAADLGLTVADKPDSQDFITGGYSQLMPSARPGPIRDKQGNRLGEHCGLPFYTIGQRRRLGISTSEPLYVIDINPAENAIIVGHQADLYREELVASGVNWIAIEELKEPITARARIRYRHPETEVVITPLSADRVYVKFTEPQIAITPGQTVVFYQEDIVLGSGTIERMEETPDG